MKNILKVIGIILISLLAGAVLGRLGIYPAVASIAAFILLVALDESKVTKESSSFLRRAK